MLDAETKLKKAHVILMRHPETCLYSGVFLMGTNAIKDDVPTACTNGKDVWYGREFVDSLSLSELCALVLHENLHKMLRQIQRHLDLAKDDPRRLNMAMDYVVNSVINSIQDKSLAVLPDGALVNPKYNGWSVREVYNDLPPQKDEDEDGGGGEGGSMDAHDFDDAQDCTPEELKEWDREIDEAVRQGTMLAGKFGAKVPRVIEDSLKHKVDWREVLREFVTTSMAGKADYTWRQFNRRRVADDYYLPSTIDDTLSEIVVAIDTSGSISAEQLNEFASELSAICSSVKPQCVRILWWDYNVASEQLIMGDYSGLAAILKPAGGGGTRVSCVRDYIVKHRLKPDCVVVFTDGYVEHDINWSGVEAPTLWVITQNKGMRVPAGSIKVNF